MMARPVDKLPPGAPLPVASNWCHSICDLVKIDCEWTIHQFQLRDDVEHSTEFPVGGGNKDSAGMTWKLSVDDEGINIAHSICDPDEPITFTGNCTKSFRVKCAFVNSSRFKVSSKECIVRKGMKMPVNIYEGPREHLSPLANGNLIIYCEIEIFKDNQELMGRSVNVGHVVGPQLSNIEQLMNHFQELFESMNMSDVTFNVRGHQIRAHQTILAARSPVFDAMFQYPTREIVTDIVDVSDMEPDVLRIMLRYIYTGQVSLKQMDEVAIELLGAANKYRLENLKYECGKHLEKWMSPENCFKLLSLNENEPAFYLREKAIDFIRQNPSKVMSLDSWKKACKEKPVWIVGIKEMLLETLVLTGNPSPIKITDPSNNMTQSGIRVKIFNP